MNPVVTIIAKELQDQNARFVFPSETAASAWAQKICGLTGTRSIALNRFLAWDRFKEEIIRSEVQDKQPVSDVIRKLFTEALVRKNAAAARSVKDTGAAGAGGFPFRSLIPPDYAENGSIFAAQIAGVLPSLKLLKTRQEESAKNPGDTGPQGAYTGDDEDRDFALLEREYGEFLDRNGLFEPSWERPPLRDKLHSYSIFFPEAIEDFAEYEGILRAEPTIHLINIEENGAAQTLFQYRSSRAEIRAAVLELRRLHEEAGVPYEDMAVSVPGLEDLEVYLLRELSLYNVPHRRRSGRPLADYGTGKLFSLISACVGNNFSFSALKSLILNERLPWAYPELNKQLIDFGVANNCVSAYRDKGRPVDIWTEAFKSAPREERLRQYYEELKKTLTAITASKNFADIRNRYFAFRGQVWEKSTGENTNTAKAGFLSRDTCTDEGNAVLARCVEELSALIQVEEDYPDLIPPSPFAFYLSLLKEKQYVPQQQQSGVNIFPYRVAAASPFTCHFILNAAQGAATVLYRPLKFLRQDKRNRLGVQDTDASASFFRLYRLGDYGTFKPYLWISSSEQTFSGWAIPNSFFVGTDPAETGGRTIPAPPTPEDAFTQERQWWAAGGSLETGSAGAAFPPRLFSVQKAGFDRWQQTLALHNENRFSVLREPFAQNTTAANMVRDRITAKQQITAEAENGGEAKTCLRASATKDLNDFFCCHALWLYKKIFGLENLSLEAQLLDDTSLGLLYHRILADLFTRIRETDGVFNAAHVETYRSWIQEITEADAREHPSFQGPLAVPLVLSQANAIRRRLTELLKTEARYFPGYTVGELESSLTMTREGLYLNGVLDRVSVSPEDGPVIIDYKTGAPPTKKDSSETADSPLADFQMPMYVRLYEEKTGLKVEGAFFISIHKNDITAVIGSPERKKGFTREAYQETLDAFDFYTGQFRESVQALDFSLGEIHFETCAVCDYRNICRTTYSLNSREYDHAQ